MQEKGKDFFAMLAERDHTTVEKVKEKISKRIWEGAWVNDTTPIELPKVNPNFVFEMVDKYKDKI